jgi:hypothetical protein
MLKFNQFWDSLFFEKISELYDSRNDPSLSEIAQNEIEIAFKVLQNKVNFNKVFIIGYMIALIISYFLLTVLSILLIEDQAVRNSDQFSAVFMSFSVFQFILDCAMIYVIWLNYSRLGDINYSQPD